LICLRAESDQGLSEITVYDNTRLYRRFMFDGKTNVCELLVNAVHDHQHKFTAVVKDVAGHMAISAPQDATDLFNRRCMCGDRENSLSGTDELDRDGYRVDVRACFSQFKFNYISSFAFPMNPQTVDRVSPYWDGCPGGYVNGNGRSEPTMWMPPAITPQPSNTFQAVVQRMEYPLGSRDVICQAIGTEYMIPDKKQDAPDGFYAFSQ